MPKSAGNLSNESESLSLVHCYKGHRLAGTTQLLMQRNSWGANDYGEDLRAYLEITIKHCVVIDIIRFDMA